MTVSAPLSLCGVALLIATTAASLLPPSRAMALPVWSHQRAEIFATCSGRMAALAAHFSASSSAKAQEHEHSAETFDLLLEAVLPDAMDQGVTEQEPILWRSQGWSEIAALLADATYSLDTRRIDRANKAVERRIADCRDLLL